MKLITFLTLPSDLLDGFRSGNSSLRHSFNSGPTDETGRCRWSTHSGEPLLFIKYDKRMLNIVDTEKKVFILKDPFELEREERRNSGNYI